MAIGSSKYPPHLRSRVRILQRRLRDKGVGVLLITNPADIRYLTGFVGEDSWAVVRSRSITVYVVTDSRYEQQIGIEAPHVRSLVRRGTLVNEVGILAEKLQLNQIGLQMDYITLSQRNALVKQIGARKLVPFDDGLFEDRAIKDKLEVGAIQKALRMAQQAFRQTVSLIRPGMTEFEVAAELEYQMRRRGADKASFDTIVAIGPNAALPHAIPGRRKVPAQGLILIDWGARTGGYCCDLTRTLAVGRMPRQVRDVYQVVLEAQLAAIDSIAPGRKLKQIDAVARELITKAGYGAFFGHGLGHGIGLDIHERPVLSHQAAGVLRPGHVVTVEPGIYLPGVGGVRIEDDVLVTKRGHRVLSNLPKTLDCAII